MDIFSCVLLLLSIMFLIVAGVMACDGIVSMLIFIGVFLIVLYLLIFLEFTLSGKMKGGEPAPLSILVTGGKYRVLDTYEKYIIIKSDADDKELKFIGPLDVGSITTGKYVKTLRGGLEKIE